MKGGSVCCSLPISKPWSFHAFLLPKSGGGKKSGPLPNSGCWLSANSTVYCSHSERAACVWQWAWVHLQSTGQSCLLVFFRSFLLMFNCSHQWQCAVQYCFLCVCSKTLWGRRVSSPLLWKRKPEFLDKQHRCAGYIRWKLVKRQRTFRTSESSVSSQILPHADIDWCYVVLLQVSERRSQSCDDSFQCWWSRQEIYGGRKKRKRV